MLPGPFYFAARVCLNMGVLVLCVLWLWEVGQTSHISEGRGLQHKAVQMGWTSCASSGHLQYALSSSNAPTSQGRT